MVHALNYLHSKLKVIHRGEDSMLNIAIVIVVVQSYPCLKLYSTLLGGMVMYG